jgi:hypothetical protein
VYIPGGGAHPNSIPTDHLEGTGRVAAAGARHKIDKFSKTFDHPFWPLAAEHVGAPCDACEELLQAAAFRFGAKRSHAALGLTAKEGRGRFLRGWRLQLSCGLARYHHRFFAMAVAAAAPLAQSSHAALFWLVVRRRFFSSAWGGYT